jgi:hypothetical protein
MRTKEELAAYHREWRAKNKDRLRELNRVKMAEWRARNPEKVRESNRKQRQKPGAKERNYAKTVEWRKANADKVRKQQIRHKYGLSGDQFDAMLQAQNWCCAICGTQLRFGLGGLTVDHCHTTGRVRGILCTQCNTGVGMFRENPATFTRALAYLEAHAGL